MYFSKALATTAIFLSTMLIACYACQDTTPEKQLDFWVGEWSVTETTPNAKNPPGTNVIRKMYGGKVVHENFKMGPFEGQSWSVFNAKEKSWSQTWVDNNGGYIAMASTKVGGNLAIQTLKKAATPLAASRMVFADVKPNSFTWRWEATKDGGKTWTLAWRLAYKRKENSAELSRALIRAAVIQNRFDSLR
jgi:hypothetical protein